MTDDARRYSPSTLRNRDPILAVLRRHLRYLPEPGLVLEIASGTGEHITHFAANLGRDVSFQPSDPDPAACASVDAWVGELGLTQIRPALVLDVTAPVWPVTHADAVLCCNMIHIAPWAAGGALVAGAGRLLPVGGVLYLYGPFRRNGQHTAPSNADFDADLRQRNPAWGIRDLEAVVTLATAAGFGAPDIEAMPANNLSVIFRRRAS
jgi:SAM-dependent methyltransferase